MVVTAVPSTVFVLHTTRFSKVGTAVDPNRLAAASLVVLVREDGPTRTDPIPGRATRFSVSPVCWLNSFTGSFALPASSRVLKVAFQPFEPNPMKRLGGVRAISGAVAAERTVEVNDSALDDETGAKDGTVVAQEVVTARAVFVSVTVS